MLKNVSAAVEVKKLPEPEMNRKQEETSAFLRLWPQRRSLTPPPGGAYPAADGRVATGFADCSENGRPWTGYKAAPTHGR